MSLSNLHPHNAKVNSKGQENAGFYYGRISEQVVSSGVWAKLSKKAAKVYIAALSHARDQNKNWEVWPSNETLARESGIHERLIPSARREIEGAGLIFRKWRVDRQIHYEFAGTGFPTVKTTHHTATIKRPRDHHGRYTTADHTTVGNSTTYTEPVPQIMEAAVPQIMDTKETSLSKQMKETLSHDDVVEERIAAHAQGEEGSEAALLLVSDTAISQRQEDGAGGGVGKAATSLEGRKPSPERRARPQKKRTAAKESSRLIRDFRRAIGQPPQKASFHERGTITDLLTQGYTIEQIDSVIARIASNPVDSQGMRIGSIAYLLKAVERAAVGRLYNREKRQDGGHGDQKSGDQNDTPNTAERLALKESARKQEEDESNREALALAEEWKKNKPAWMSDKYYAWLLKQGIDQAQATPTTPASEPAEQSENTQAVESAPAAAPEPEPVEQSVGKGQRQARITDEELTAIVGEVYDLLGITPSTNLAMERQRLREVEGHYGRGTVQETLR